MSEYWCSAFRLLDQFTFPVRQLAREHYSMTRIIKMDYSDLTQLWTFCYSREDTYIKIIAAILDSAWHLERLIKKKFYTILSHDLWFFKKKNLIRKISKTWFFGKKWRSGSDSAQKTTRKMTHLISWAHRSLMLTSAIQCGFQLTWPHGFCKYSL